MIDVLWEMGQAVMQGTVSWADSDDIGDVTAVLEKSRVSESH